MNDKLLCATASLFLIPAAHAWNLGHRLEAICTTIVVLHSWVYHYTQNPTARMVDMLGNFMFGSIFTTYAVFHMNYIRIFFAGLAVMGYIVSRRLPECSWCHALCVHVPAAIGLYHCSE